MPAPVDRGIPISEGTRRFLLKISTIILFAIIGVVGISYVVSLLGHTPSPSGGTPPAIQSVTVSNIAETSAVITWETDQPATSQVMLCDPDDVCTWTEPDGTLVTNHSVTLGDLEPNTTYHYTVISANEDEEEEASGGEFQTSASADTTPPEISEVLATNTTESSATIEWTTNEESTSQVEYGTSEDYGSSTSLEEELTTSHTVTITGLEPETTYHFRVKSKDGSGNEGISAPDQTFETPPPIPVGPEEGNRAPDFTLQNLAGDDIRLNDFRGEIVMVNFWFAACEPCEVEMPHIQAVSDSWPDRDLTILSINRIDDAEEIQSYMESQQLTFPALIDAAGSVHADYGVDEWPTTFFIDSERIIREIHVGAFDNQQEIEDILDGLQ